MHQDLTEQIIGSAIEVHRHLGPGLLESAYQVCLARELEVRGIPYQIEQPLRLEYKGIAVPSAYRIDLVVAEQVIVEVKAVETLNPISEAQLLTYLRLSGLRVGLLLNFNVAVLKDGIRRRIH